MAADKKCVSRRDFLAGAAMAAAALAGCSAGSGAKAEPAAKWGFERDDDLPLLCMEVSGGSVVAATGDGWAPNGDFVQLHLGGGSIPGTQVKSVTSETDGARLTVVLESGGVSTLDLVWTGFSWLTATRHPIPMAVPWRNCPRRVFFLAFEAAFAF